MYLYVLSILKRCCSRLQEQMADGIRELVDFYLVPRLYCVGSRVSPCIGNIWTDILSLLQGRTQKAYLYIDTLVSLYRLILPLARYPVSSFVYCKLVYRIMYTYFVQKLFVPHSAGLWFFCSFIRNGVLSWLSLSKPLCIVGNNFRRNHCKVNSSDVMIHWAEYHS